MRLLHHLLLCGGGFKDKEIINGGKNQGKIKAKIKEKETLKSNYKVVQSILKQPLPVWICFYIAYTSTFLKRKVDVYAM